MDSEPPPNTEEPPFAGAPAGGWLKLWRCLMDSAIWSKPPLYGRVWTWLLVKATHEGNAEKRNLPPGVFTTTYSQMADALQWDENNRSRIPDRKTLTRILEWMESEQMIAVEACHKRFTKITLLNWATYQRKEDELVPSKGTTKGTSKGTPIKNVENEKHVKKEPTTYPAEARGALEVSPHWAFIERLSKWFYELPHTTNPTPHELLEAQKVVELILRKDMSGQEGCQERLEKLLLWGTQDEPNERWPGWKAQLKSLAQLREKRAGVMKWEKIEAGMNTKRYQANGNPRTPVSQRKEYSRDARDY